MKILFWKQDSIYKLFKTIKKIPAHKSVIIFIDPENSFFEHARRGTQLKDLLKVQQLHATFPTVTHKQAEYFEHIGLSHFKEGNEHWFRGFARLKEMFFSTKSVHEKLLVKKNFISYLIILSEVVVIGLVIYLCRGLVSPNARLVLQPAYTVEEIVYSYYYYPWWAEESTIPDTHLSIPYQIGTLPFDYEMTVDVSNITFEGTAAKGTVNIFNTLSTPFSLLANTKLVTDDGILFQTDERVDIPAGSKEQPGVVTVPVTALETMEDGTPIGENGNIEKNALLRIKNLPESMIAKQLYAEATTSFKGWSTTSTGTVVSEDIERIETLITDYMKENQHTYLKEHMTNADHLLLPFPELLRLTIDEFITTSSVGDSATFVEGKVRATIHYVYVDRKEITRTTELYLKQRPTEGTTLYDYDKHSVTFYELRPTSMTGHYLIPTKTNGIRWYDFDQDTNAIVQEIKSKIVGLSIDEARSIILSYPEIAQATVSLSPPRYDMLPQVTSRIKVLPQEAVIVPTEAIAP